MLCDDLLAERGLVDEVFRFALGAGAEWW